MGRNNPQNPGLPSYLKFILSCLRIPFFKSRHWSQSIYLARLGVSWPDVMAYWLNGTSGVSRLPPPPYPPPHIWFLLSHFNTRQRVKQSPTVKVMWCVQGVLIVLLCALNLMRDWINPIHISNVYAELFFLWPNALIQYLLSTVCQTSTHQVKCVCGGEVGGSDKHIAKMTKCLRFVCIILVQFTLHCCLQRFTISLYTYNCTTQIQSVWVQTQNPHSCRQ